MRWCGSPCPGFGPWATTVDLAPVAYLRQHLGEERFDSGSPLAPQLTLLLPARLLRRARFPAEALLTLRAHPGQSTDRVRELPAQGPIAVVGADAPPPGLPAGRCALHPHPRLGRLPQSPTTFRLVFQSPTRASTQLDGSAPYIGAAGCQRAGSAHRTFSFVPPGMNWALLGLLTGVLMLVPTARSASSFGVRR